MSNFHTLETDKLHKLIKFRENETKLGEKVSAGNFDRKFVIIGIPESIGVQANGGIGGTETLWKAFLTAFLNIQSTDKLSGNEISIAGSFIFEPNEQIEKIDEEVANLVEKVVTEDKIPILIGGGHNNAYPILKGVSQAKNQPINVINLDAHSDFRLMEGRHSGNGFRYAMNEGFLGKYSIIGLHENYNSQLIINDLYRNKNIDFVFFEDIFVREKVGFQEAINQAIRFTNNTFTGIEVDVDCIENVLSSAMTPCGISTIHARQFLHKTAQNCKVAYLHIAEGATELENGLKNPLTGKLISYLVSDFIKAIK